MVAMLVVAGAGPSEAFLVHPSLHFPLTRSPAHMHACKRPSASTVRDGVRLCSMDAGALNPRLLRLQEAPAGDTNGRRAGSRGRGSGGRGGVGAILRVMQVLADARGIGAGLGSGRDTRAAVAYKLPPATLLGRMGLSPKVVGGLLGRGRGLSPALRGGWVAGLGVVGRVVAVVMCGLFLQFMLGVAGVGAHMAPSASVGEGSGIMPPPWKIGLLIALLVTSACLAGAETAITTLWPWKVKKIAEEEDEKSPFRMLENDITKFLTAILIGTTTCTIYAAGLAADMAGSYGGDKMVTWATIWLTLVTLVAGEIIPKALAVSRAESVARAMVPIINVLAIMVFPIGKLMQITSRIVLTLMGVSESEENSVSEEELRMIVMGAKVSGQIKTEEQDMIESVLDLQDTFVTAIMKPRVEIVAVEASTDIRTFVRAVSESGYSRIPVYDDNIDNIIGMVLAKSLIDYLDRPDWIQGIEQNSVADIMDPAYYVPQSMTVWNALEEMRMRRIHMAIVVDEYGGTAGLITLEDILEEVIGEIYDEDDIEEMVKEQSSIYLEVDGSYTIDGFADLKDAAKVLQIDILARDLEDYGTVSGYLCHKAGCIPPVGTVLLLPRLRLQPAQVEKDTSDRDSDSPFKRDKPEELSPPDLWKVSVTSADERKVVTVSASLVEYGEIEAIEAASEELLMLDAVDIKAKAVGSDTKAKTAGSNSTTINRLE